MNDFLFHLLQLYSIFVCFTRGVWYVFFSMKECGPWPWSLPKVCFVVAAHLWIFEIQEKLKNH